MRRTSGTVARDPGSRWTIWTTPEQQQAFAWIKANTPDTAIVQMEPVVRGREHWTLIPSFAGRRMAAGLPISLLPLPDNQERSDRVKAIFSTSDALRRRRRGAGVLRIDYLYVDENRRCGLRSRGRASSTNTRHSSSVCTRTRPCASIRSGRRRQPLRNLKKVRVPMNQSRSPIFLPSSLLLGLYMTGTSTMR